MSSSSQFQLLLIVTGSTLRAEEADRPLGYYLKQKIEEKLRSASEKPGTEEGSRLAHFQVRVIADFRWIHDEFLQRLPTISLGGPGVNALSHRWLEEVPITLAFNEHYFIQMDPDGNDPRACVWGMDNPATQLAVAVFLDRYLPVFLERCASMPEASFEPDEDYEGDDDEIDDE